MRMMPVSGIAFGRAGGMSSNKSEIIATSNYYVGCSTDPNFKYQRSLDRQSTRQIAEKYGDEVAENISAAVKGGAKIEELEKMLKVLPKKIF